MGIEEINPTDMEKLVYLIATGNRSEIDYYLDKWHKKENNRDKKVRDIYEKDHNVLFRRMSILSEGKKSDG